MEAHSLNATEPHHLLLSNRKQADTNNDIFNSEDGEEMEDLAGSLSALSPVKFDSQVHAVSKVNLSKWQVYILRPNYKPMGTSVSAF
jgi:hypothetical protein